MPLTAFQREVFGTLRRNRSPESFVFGATVLNATERTPRFSRDIDLCHDLETAVAQSASADADALAAAGFSVTCSAPTTVDWEAIRRNFARPVDAGVLEQLKVLDGIASVHRTTWGALEIIEPIGRGSFGTVFLVKEIATG